MYNVGFGDAFLVLFNGSPGAAPLKILFDCGSIEAAENQPIADVVERIVADVTDPDQVPRIDVVVATHRHKDHVSGFGNKLWDSVEVKEVWMPWTEDESDPEARRIRDVQSRLALTLNANLAAAASRAAAPETQLAQKLAENALFLSNDRAMKTLHHGFATPAVRRFLPKKTVKTKKAVKNRHFTTDALPGIKVYVIGPARDAEVIRDMDPPSGKSYLRLSARAAGPEAVAASAPFDPSFVRQTSETLASLDVKDEQTIQSAGSFGDLAVAVALDKAVNGTSLMLLLEVAGTFLLFPGDAQWGTWEAALTDPEWRSLLGRVSFYKIGHHGSHNATPKEFVERVIPDSIYGMASTLTRAIWPDIPKGELLSAFQRRHASVVRSDQESVPMPRGFKQDKGVVELTLAL
jgi:beta-lactamase superfamily II metal-dependent hydrolase